MKTAKYVLLLLITLFSVSHLGAVNIDQVLARRPRAALLPPSDTAILYHGTAYTISADGRVERQEHIVRYLRTPNAWDEYGDPHIAFDSSRQELEVLISRTYTTDGRKVDTTPNGLNPIVPFGLDKVADFTNMRQMVVTHLGIENDAVTELEYVIRDKQALYPWAWAEVLMSSLEPILEREVTATAPRNVVLSARAENGAPEGEVSLGGDTQTITWRMTDLEGVDPAEAGSKMGLYLPKVAFSTCPDWDALTSEIATRFDAAMQEDGSLTEEVAHLRKIEDVGLRLDSLVTFVKDRIAVVRFHDLGFLLNYRSAARTYSTGYGSPADMTVLYAQALKGIGLDSKVYLLGAVTLAVPGLTGDEAYSIHIDAPDLTRRLDPASGNLDYLPPDNVSYVGVWPAAVPKTLPASPYQENGVSLGMNITFDEEGGAQGFVLIRTYGQLAQFPAAREKGAEEVVKGWMEGLFSKPEVKNAIVLQQRPDRVEIRADLSFPPVEDELDDSMEIPLPRTISEVKGLLPEGLALHHVGRDVPVFLSHTGTVELNLEVQIPEEWTIVLLPKSYDATAAGVSFDRSVKNEGNKISVTQKVTFPEARISSQNWDAWRGVLLQEQKPSTRTLLLNTGK